MRGLYPSAEGFDFLSGKLPIETASRGTVSSPDIEEK